MGQKRGSDNKKKGKDAGQTGTETVFEATAHLWVLPIPWLRESES